MINVLIKKLSLKELVFAVVLVPIIGYLILATGVLRESWARLTKASTLGQDFALIDPISDLVHYSQIERGTSVVYMTGGVGLDVLETRRRKTDEFLEQVVRNAADGTFAEESKVRLKNLRSAYEGFRGKVTVGASPAEVVKLYTSEIGFLLGLYFEAAKNSPSREVTALYKDLVVLEKAKENGGLFRAKLSGYISNGQPLTEDKITTLQNLRGGFETLMSMDLQSLTGNVSAMYQRVLSTDHWAEAKRRHIQVLQKSAEGSFGINSAETFNIITKSVNDVKGVIEAHRKVIFDQIELAKSQYMKTFSTNAAGLAMISFVIALMSLLVVRRLDHNLGEITEMLRRNVHDLSNIGSLISLNSRNLNRGTSSVQAAVESTSSASHEIGELLESNKRLIVGAREGNELTQAKVSDGLRSVQSMKSAMTQIEKMNVHVIAEVRKSQDSFKQLVDIIGKISEKTGVIDEIVFQTKLLAFNASVEAARAGEAGKGFAVVAEEIGNLASLSGNASSEIASLLGESMNESQKMQSELNASMARVQEDSKSTVAEGVKLVDVCSTVLDEISAQSEGTSKSLDEFVVAFSEQTSGLEHIEKSVHDLLELNGETAELAKKNVESAKRLSSRSVDIQKGVRFLDELSRGRHMPPAGSFSQAPEEEAEAGQPNLARPPSKAA